LAIANHPPTSWISRKSFRSHQIEGTLAFVIFFTNYPICTCAATPVNYPSP
jgi:hypothetical protein